MIVRKIMRLKEIEGFWLSADSTHRKDKGAVHLWSGSNRNENLFVSEIIVRSEDLFTH